MRSEEGILLALCPSSGGALGDVCGRRIYPRSSSSSIALRAQGLLPSPTRGAWPLSPARSASAGGGQHIFRPRLWSDSREKASVGYIHVL